MDNLNYQVLGMHFIWWFLWIFILIWIFATPYEIPGQRSKKGSPLDILKKVFNISYLLIFSHLITRLCSDMNMVKIRILFQKIR